MAEGFAPTHSVPAAGLPAYHDKDASVAPAAQLTADLPVQVVERWGDWARIRCSNEWEAWVDGRHLVANPASVTAPTSSGPPTAATPAPRPATPVPAATAARAGGITISYALIGAALLALATVLPWLRKLDVRQKSINGFRPSAAFLVDYKTDSQGGLSVGLLLVLVAAAGAYALYIRNEQWRRIIGFVGVGICVLFLIQIQRVVGLISDQAGGADTVNIFDVIGIGIFVALAGAVGLATAPTGSLTGGTS